MKTLVLIAAIFSCQAFAASITITSDEATEKEALQPLSQELLSLLMDQGYRLADMGSENGGGVHFLELRDLKCEYFSRQALDPEDPTMGLPSLKCRAYGGRIKDSRALVDILNKVEVAANGAVYFTDCAMGRCEIAARTINCKVDTKIEQFRNGRFSCTLTDTQ